uniref:Uncharacterized protein n=1 Tax=Oryza sativa subsp. japonica TaxID=39947 RepID=Q6EP28_ORYSJ|nr:hypothetical protein [Oryza sativa Japonica Group]BAD29592.1 hypothetical protein [Oryza sativa Japonica Group]
MWSPGSWGLEKLPVNYLHRSRPAREPPIKLLVRSMASSVRAPVLVAHPPLSSLVGLEQRVDSAAAPAILGALRQGGFPTTSSMVSPLQCGEACKSRMSGISTRSQLRPSSSSPALADDRITARALSYRTPGLRPKSLAAADALMMGGLWMLDALVNECVDEFANAPGCRGVDALYRASPGVKYLICNSLCFSAAGPQSGDKRLASARAK